MQQFDPIPKLETTAGLLSEIKPDNRASVVSSLADDPELMADFILESRDHLANIVDQILRLERNGPDAEVLNSIFRGFHTIKGLAGFLELSDMQKAAHEVETVLDKARNGSLVIDSGGFDVILESADYLARWLTHLDAALHKSPTARPEAGNALLYRIAGLYMEQDEVPADARDGVSLATMAAAVAVAALEAQPDDASALRRDAVSKNATSIKVDTGKLDYLVDMAGELVIAESLLRNSPELAAISNPQLHRQVAQLTRMAVELQKMAMSMRLVPIGPLFRRMERLVRDLSRQIGKTVVMETEGDEIELDRTIVQELADPLMHMVRNAMDHGVEGPEERARNNKHPSARLFLKAQHQAGQVVIEVSDDGRGIDREKIVSKAIERGLIDTGEDLSDSDVHGLIFEAGFSTAAHVSSVSGRGVGMDVVRKHIEKLRGRVEIRPTLGKGATFILKLPLTLAIIEGLVVGVGAQRYLIPLFGVKEMLRPTEGTMWSVQQKVEMAMVRGSLLPVLRLYRRFQIEPRSHDPLQSVLVIAEVEGKRCCLMVDDLLGKQEVVIKALGDIFKGVRGIAGGAILGDGRIGLILDLERLFHDEAADGNC